MSKMMFFVINSIENHSELMEGEIYSVLPFFFSEIPYKVRWGFFPYTCLLYTSKYGGSISDLLF